MTELTQDPELLDNNEEGTGDESAYEVDLPDFDPDQFELPEDFEYVEDDEDA